MAVSAAAVSPGDPHDERGQLGVGGRHGQQFAVAHAGAASARVEGAADDLDPGGVRLVFDGGERQSCAGPVGEGEHGEQGGQAGQGEQQGADVPGGHRAVDDHADGHRDEGFGGLVGAEQRDAGGHPGALSTQRATEHHATGGLGDCHARIDEGTATDSTSIRAG